MSGPASTASVDLNSDVGESFGRWTLGDDAAVLRLVTSANVACGFHAGDPSTLRRCCELAAEYGVTVGAQVGYRDLAGFGRRFIDIDPVELADDVTYQIGALEAMARVSGTRVAYVKPHGALYNAAVHHEAQAQAVVDAVAAYDRDLPVLGLPGSELLARAEAAGLRPVREAFADRGYTPEGTLVARSQPGALLEDPAEVARRVVRLVTEGVVTAVDGTEVAVAAESVCLHGDTPGAVEMADAGARRPGRGQRRGEALRMRVLPYGDRALLVELADGDEALDFADALRADPPAALGDLVPAARTVLVVAAEGASVADLRADLSRVRPAADRSRADEDAEVVEIPVVYDGADLDDVASLTGLSRDEVVAAHTGQTWRVAFGGFAPGFGYLVGEDDRLHVPRREESRTAVPPGAVALAGEYAGVYPRESPGGWQLIGHTDTAVFDLDRDPPALLRPGALIRFAEVSP